MNQGSSGLMNPNYHHRPTYSPSGAGYNARSSQSPATGDGLAAPPYDSLGSTFPLPIPGTGQNHSTMLQQNSHHHSHQQPMQQSHILNSQAPASQQPPTPSTTAPTDNYSRPPPTPSYYAPPSSTPQQPSFPAYTSAQPSPTHHSPTTTSGFSRGIPAMSPHQHSPMQAPHYTNRQYGYQQLPPAMGGPVMSNMGNPGGQMTMSVGLNPMHGYPTHHLGPHHMYSHGQPPPPQDRPFKCDVCPQSFNRNHDLKRHKRIHLSVKPFPCGFCEKSFSRKDALKVNTKRSSGGFCKLTLYSDIVW